MKRISFGTDGWRGILAEDFTFDNVRLVARAVARYINAHNLAAKGIVVGYDNRFMSERFASEIARVLAEQGITVYLTARSTPTPVVALAVWLQQAGGAVMLTASHNPPEYNGFKFIPEYAGPALPHITAEIEDNIRQLQGTGTTGEDGRTVSSKASVITIDPHSDYAEHLASLVDLNAIGKAGLKIAVDPMCGAGVGYLEDLLTRAGAEVVAIHCHRDPLFGGSLPEPTAKSLQELRRIVVEGGARLGLALDGDADRFGIIDANGEFITPNQFLPLLYYHLLTFRGLEGPVARTVATTHLLDRMADRKGLKVFETPVGFKYIGQCILEQGVIVGGEESGGLSIQGHVPEKDGILAGLLAAEMVAVHGKSLTDLLEDIAGEYGHLYSERLDVHTSPADKERVLGVLQSFMPEEVAGRKVTGSSSVDGVKLLLEGGAWLLIRASGTEPLFRIYVEAESHEEIKEIQAATRSLLGL
ncbi:Phosphoglucomutase [Pelotomaculum sp. FP]|uniref:phosphoglucomutase/phosphomannomutase family protein n=1 Tax=Pelotomaculum sp. FP TaxID=261474 RepID=UPI0011000BD2|nr:phosphoglucomutase/phosphomannomutase family protein [Pelotomaculum sp. FP]TEB17708.1 Phosphoglucomutase [Pelotomaculum sp. FP]